jgi:uncharacterized OB-fold protein
VTLLVPQPAGIPVPTPSLATAPYWEACARGELRYQRCTSCGALPPRPTMVCGRCLTRSLTWEPSAGLGRLYSWTVVWRPMVPSFTVPYAPAIVELDEGFRMMSAVIGCEPDELRGDLRLAVEMHPVGGGTSLPYFRPVP